MKVAISRGDLVKTLGSVHSVVERRNTIPVLSNVLLAAGQGQLRFTATDLDIEINARADADVIRPGEITTPAATLYEIARKLHDSAIVTLELDGSEQRLNVSAEKSRFSLPVLPQSDFPTMAQENFSARFMIGARDLARLIEKTEFAISSEETRFYLNGIFLHVVQNGAGKVLRGVATDGHRLALAELPAPNAADNMPSVIVPRKAVNQIKALIASYADDVELALSENKVRLAVGATTLTSKLIDGSFPDYQRVIPKNNGRILKIENRLFAEAVDRVAIVSAERSNSIRLAMTGGSLRLSATNPDAGIAEEEVPANYDRDPFEIGFNAKYLLAVSKQIEGEDAQFEFAESGSPTLVRDPENPHALFVLMPLRV